MNSVSAGKRVIMHIRRSYHTPLDRKNATTQYNIEGEEEKDNNKKKQKKNKTQNNIIINIFISSTN